MAIRDRLVAMVLAAGVLLGLAAWQTLSPVAAVVVVLAAVVAACVIYRVDAARPQADARDHASPERRTGVRQ